MLLRPSFLIKARETTLFALVQPADRYRSPFGWRLESVDRCGAWFSAQPVRAAERPRTWSLCCGGGRMASGVPPRGDTPPAPGPGGVPNGRRYGPDVPWPGAAV